MARLAALMICLGITGLGGTAPHTETELNQQIAID